MGVDSLGTTELTSNLQTTFDVELPSTLIFNFPTIEDLSNHLHGILAIQQESDVTISTQMEVTALPAPDNNASISIVGISCHFPGNVSCPLEYWRLLCNGFQTTSQIPFGRWDSFSFAANSKLNEREKFQIMYGSFVDDMECFDSSFFGISMAEAESMSPLQRILLESTYLALQDAGFERSKINGLNCGVFVGTYSGATNEASSSIKRVSAYSATGTTASIASGRVSYVFNFQGPNAVYDTACSSSLVALNAAASSLHDRSCDIAIVAGVNELFSRVTFESCAHAGMLSPTGHCHTFDTAADMGK